MKLSLIGLFISFSAFAGNIEMPESKTYFGGTGNESCKADCVAIAADGSLLGQQPVIGYGTDSLRAYNAAIGVCRAFVEFGNDPKIVDKFLAQDVSAGRRSIKVEGYFLLGHKRVNEIKDCR